ncbi:MAG: hypothetical protein EB053_01460 [Chlamydiae bacterium]|nr:hypothetical protein [Chlamydiota bacterium]
MGHMEYQRLLSLPEERVRHHLMGRLINELDFPANLLVKERAIHQLPHFTTDELQLNIPKDRRIDLLAYTWQDGLLKPLVLFEVKHHKPDHKAFSQILGYNHWIKSPFIAFVSDWHEGLFAYNKGRLESLGSLKSYKELCCFLNP